MSATRFIHIHFWVFLGLNLLNMVPEAWSRDPFANPFSWFPTVEGVYALMCLMLARAHFRMLACLVAAFALAFATGWLITIVSLILLSGREFDIGWGLSLVFIIPLAAGAGGVATLAAQMLERRSPDLSLFR